jgi:hypothetical protein
MMQARLLTADLHGAMIAGKHFHSSLLQLEMLPKGWWYVSSFQGQQSGCMLCL